MLGSKYPKILTKIEMKNTYVDVMYLQSPRIYLVPNCLTVRFMKKRSSGKSNNEDIELNNE